MTILIEGSEMKKVISAVEARQNLGDVLSGVFYRGDEVTVERAGKPMAVLVPMRVYEAVLRQREEVMDLIRRAREANKDVPPEVLEQEAIDAVREYRREVDTEKVEKPAKSA